MLRSCENVTIDARQKCVALHIYHDRIIQFEDVEFVSEEEKSKYLEDQKKLLKAQQRFLEMYGKLKAMSCKRMVDCKTKRERIILPYGEMFNVQGNACTACSKNNDRLL